MPIKMAEIIRSAVSCFTVAYSRDSGSRGPPEGGQGTVVHLGTVSSTATATLSGRSGRGRVARKIDQPGSERDDDRLKLGARPELGDGRSEQATDVLDRQS